MKKHGFTIIELLVTISIMGALSSLVLTGVSKGRAKAYDAKRIADLHTILTGYLLYNSNGGGTLTNYGCNGSCQTSDTNPNFLSELISDGTFINVPKATHNDAANPYMYYDYGSGNPYGFMVVTELEASPASLGYPDSCRPFHAVNNWCRDDLASNDYCLCFPY